MPWDADSFKKHNKKLSGSALSRAAAMASAMVRSGVPEGEAIATANKHGDKLMRKRDSGGPVSESEFWRNELKSHGGEQIGVGRLEDSDPDADPRMNKLSQSRDKRTRDTYLEQGPEDEGGVRPLMQPFLKGRDSQNLSTGGGTRLSDHAYRLSRKMAREQEKQSESNNNNAGHFAMGGADIPYFARSEARELEYSNEHPRGLINIAGPGRTDTFPTSLRSGSYVLPADVISGLGSGNTGFGADVVDKMLRSGPYGTAPLRIGRSGRGVGIPPAPKPFTDWGIHSVYPEHFASGGEDKDGMVPVVLAGGEFVVSPEEVAQIGGGQLKRGYQILDSFIKEVRKKHIDTLKKLPGPKAAHEK